MRAVGTLLRDPALALVTLAFLTHGAFVASLVPYRSLLGVTWFGLSDGAFAALFAAGSGLSLVCAIGVGLVNDRTGRRRNAARIAAAAGVAGAALVAATEATWAFVLANLLFFPVGATLFAQLFTLARLAASSHPPAERAAILAAIRAAFAVPWVVVLPVWSWAFAAGAPLVWVYRACVVAEAVTLAVFLLAWPRDGRTRWADPGSGLTLGAALAELSRRAVLVRVALLSGVLGGVQMYLILTGLILTGVAGRDAGDVALFAGGVAALEIPFMLALAAPLARFGQVRLIAGAALLYAGFLVAFPLLGPFPVVWALPVVAAAGAAVLLTVPNAYLQDLMDDRPGAGGALIALTNLAAQLLAAGLFWAGAGLSGYGLAATFGAAAVAAGGLGLARADRAPR